jgi:hypothetical protein
LFAWQLTIAGLWEDFFFAYFQSNIQYSSSGRHRLVQLLSNVFAQSAQDDSLLHLWLPGTLFCSALLFRFRRSPQWPVWSGVAACLAAVTVIFSPGRPFLHYWHLMVLPCIFLLAALIENLPQSNGPAGWSRHARSLW